MLFFFFLVFLYFILHHSVLFLSVSGLSSSQRVGTQPPLPLSLWLLHFCKDSRGREEVITTPKFLPPGSRVTTAREEREGNVPSLSHDNRQQRISTPVMSQLMRWCLLTWHRKAEGCRCFSDPAERKKKETRMLFILASTHDEGEERRVSRVICRFGKTVINMTNGALCAFDNVCHCHASFYYISLSSPSCDSIFHIDSGYWVKAI